MEKNVAGQKWIVFAFDRTDNTPKTGDAANITAGVYIDGAAIAALTDVNPVELANGLYVFDLTQGETNGDYIVINPVSVTADIQVIGDPGSFITTPPNFNALGIESDGDVTKVNTLDGHTAQTGDSYPEVSDADYGLSKLVRSTTPANTLDVSATGEAGLDFDNIKDATGAHTLTNITVPVVTTNTDMRGTDGANTVVPDAAGVAATPADVATALTDIKLDHLLAVADADDVADNSIIAKMVASDGDWSGYTNTDDSLEAIRDRGDAAWTTGAGGSSPTVEQIRAEIDSNSTQLMAIVADTNEIQGKLPTNNIMGSSVKTAKDDEIDAIKVILDKLDTALVIDGAVYQYTANALELAPSGGGGGDATLANQTDMIDKLKGIMNKAYTLLSAVGAFDPATDSLEAIRDEGDLSWITGDGLSGSNICTLTIQDGDGANIVECAVEIWDSAGTTFYERRTTNSSGVTVHNLDDGTYMIKMHKAGYTFDNETLIVDGVETVTYVGESSAPSNPLDPNVITVYEYCLGADHLPVSEVEATATIKSLPYEYDGAVYSGQVYDGVYNATTGVVYWNIVKGCRARFVIELFGVDTIKTVPLTGTVLRLSEMT